MTGVAACAKRFRARGGEGQTGRAAAGAARQAEPREIMTADAAIQLRAKRTGPLSGSARPPGDKSISHRALMLGTMAVGETGQVRQVN